MDMRRLCFPCGSVVKNLPTNAGDVKRHGFDPWVGKIPWRRAWQPTPVFLPGESHAQRSLVDYSPWGLKESDMTEELTLTKAIMLIYFFAKFTQIKWTHFLNQKLKHRIK